MRDPPSDLPDATLRACIGADYGLDVAELTFLPLGHDAWAWVYRVRTLDGGDYFLKVRRQLANLPGLLVPRHLRDRGSTQVVAPIPTAAGALWAEAGGYALVLYPFVAGETGMAQGLTAEQWIAYGALLRQVHETAPGPDLLPVMRREDFAPASAELIPRLDAHIGDRDFADPGERAVARFWQTRRALIRALLERARELGRRLARSAPPLVLCHADSHTANVLVDADGRVWFVDWDETILAPRERDLMFVVGGISRRLVGPREEALSFRGYGPVAVDPVALAYHRYAWAVSDIGAYAEQVCLRTDLGPESKRESVERFLLLFEPGEIVDLALTSTV